MSAKSKTSGIEVRRSQVIANWGVGAIVPFSSGQSALVAGIDQWDNSAKGFVVKDDRLAKKLKVSGFRCPPPYYENGGGSGKPAEEMGKTIPTYLFPTLYYCSDPNCGFVQMFEPTKGTKAACYQHGKDVHPLMIPERFVVACPDGHIMNLPILEKFRQLSGGSFDPDRWKNDAGYRKEHKIYRYSSEKTASIGGIGYSLGKGEDRLTFSIGDLTRKDGLSGLYPRDCCPGSRPWLDNAKPDACSVTALTPGEDTTPCLRVVQRGGTNVWLPHIESSIYIPPFAADGGADEYAAILQDAECISFLDDFATSGDGALQKACEFVLQSMLGRSDLDPEELFRRYKKFKSEDGKKESDQEETEDAYRYTEYRALSSTCGKDGDDLYVISKPISNYSSLIAPFFESVSLVKSLKETQALVGFSRINGYRGDLASAKRLLSKGATEWVPAIQTTGEGIFLRFNEERVQQWIGWAVKERAEKMDRHNSLSYRYGNITAPFVMIHTFAHAFITEISRVCGYGSSSIRERMYVSSNPNYPMLGVLIYTSGSGSDATLGGLVRQGRPGFLESLVMKTIESVGWCADDPICITSSGQGPDSCNLAACHNCCLLPETCCETGNRFLDRGMLIGDPIQGDDYGYFSSLFTDTEGVSDES